MAVVVVRLRPTERPPEDDDWVLVERDRSGTYVVRRSAVRHGRGATFYVPEPPLENELEAAIEKATTWAEQHQIEAVYVREGFLASDDQEETSAP
jgi:hypothetical protein